MLAPRSVKLVAAAVVALGWTVAVVTLLGASHLAAMVWISGLLIATLAVLVSGLIAVPRRRARDSDDGDDTDDDDGGGGGGGPPPDGEPPWWPDFERQFREHAGARDRDRDRGRAPSGPSYLRRR
ncbi:MAG: hypothetical protein M3P50_02235 [Actinomycetota bacterium]|nr:hypothetical protein [Actinomycetota bacterium]